MDASGRQPWLRRLILAGLVYFVVGIAFAAFAGWSTSNQMRVTWRFLAFVISAVAFATHTGYEYFQLGNSPRATALHAAGAIAVGAFALAVAANVHGLWADSSHQRLLVFALVAWPVPAPGSAVVVAFGSTAGRKHWLRGS